MAAMMAWWKKIRKLIIPKGVITNTDQINVVEVPHNVGKNDSLIVRRQGNRLVAQILPDFRDHMSSSKEVDEDDVCLTLSDQRFAKRGSDRSVRFELSGCRSAESSVSRDFGSDGESGGGGGGAGGFGGGLRRFGAMEQLNESTFDPTVTSTPQERSLEWTDTADAYYGSGAYEPFASSLVDGTPSGGPDANVTYGSMCVNRMPRFGDASARVSARTDSGPGSNVEVETRAEANVQMTNAYLRKAMEHTQDVLDQAQQSYEPPSATASEPGRRGATRGPKPRGKCLPGAGPPPTMNATYPQPTPRVPYQQPTRPPSPFGQAYFDQAGFEGPSAAGSAPCGGRARASRPQGRRLPGAGAPPTMNASYPQPGPRLPYQRPRSPPPSPFAQAFQAQSFEGPSAAVSEPCGGRAPPARSPKPQGRRLPRAGAPPTMNASYPQPGPRLPYQRPRSPPPSPFAQAFQAQSFEGPSAAVSEPCGGRAPARAPIQRGKRLPAAGSPPTMNATYPQPAPRLPYQRPTTPTQPSYRSSSPSPSSSQRGPGSPCAGAANATFMQDTAGTYTIPEPSFHQPSYAFASFGSSGVSMPDSSFAANSTFQSGGGGPVCGQGANATFARQASPTANATFARQASPTANATFARQASPVANATFRQASPTANATFRQPSPTGARLNATYQQAPCGVNATYQQSPPGPNATYQEPAPGPNATYQQPAPGPNATYQQAPAAYQPNATYQQAPGLLSGVTCGGAGNATYQERAQPAGGSCSGSEGTASDYTSSEYSSSFIPDSPPREEKMYTHFEQGNLLSSSRLSDYDSADPKNFPAFEHYRREMYGPDESEEDSMTDEAFAAIMDGRHNVIQWPAPPLPPIPKGYKTIGHPERCAPARQRISESYNDPRALRRQELKAAGVPYCSGVFDEKTPLSYLSSISGGCSF